MCESVCVCVRVCTMYDCMHSQLQELLNSAFKTCCFLSGNDHHLVSEKG